jgi:hypothetical protein
MKHVVKIIVFSAMLPFSVICSANPPHMGMAADQGKMDPVKMEQHLKEMQEQSLIMHDLSNKILAETDPQKQQALKDQQLELMKAHHQKMMAEHHGKAMAPKQMAK